MAASMFRQSLKLSRLIRSNTPLLWRYSPTVNPKNTQVVISRTITQKQMQENQKIFFKRVAQFVGFGVFLYVISPWARQLKGAKFESRRDKKRRRLAAEQSEVENTGISYGEPFLNYQESSSPSRGILPVVKAADVTDFGTGYVTPRSQQFNFIADAVAKASPSVVFIEIHGRYNGLSLQSKRIECLIVER